MNFLKRRFSSQDLDDDQAQAQAQSQQSDKASIVQSTPPSSSFSLSGLAQRVSSTISAPTSPSKPQQQSQTILSQLSKNIMQPVPSSETINKTGTGPCLLVVDDERIDWAKYFRSAHRGLSNQLRVEQASFGDFTVSSHSETGSVVELRNGRIFQPDLVLFRQPARSERGDFSGVLVALLQGRVRSLNSPASSYSFLNKAWVWTQLMAMQRSIGKENLPLLQRQYLPIFRHFEMGSIQFPVVVKIGHGTHGQGKMRVENAVQLSDLEGIILGQDVIVEPFIDTRCDLHLHKIGPSLKAFVRKSISSTGWKSNTNAAVLEQVNMTERHKQWLNMTSQMFGGMQVCSMHVLVGKDGRELIYDVNNDAITLLENDTQDEDRRALADLVLAQLRPECPPPPLPAGPIRYPPPPPPVQQVQQVQQVQENGSTARPPLPTGHHPPVPPPVQQVQQVQENGATARPPPPRPVRQPSLKETKEEDTMGQLKRTFAGIFGDM